MGNGFKRFIDFSPLSVKCLNDQLEQLWLKVMGGISYRDLDSNTRTIIQSKMDEDGVMSVIEQSSNELLMAVGKAGGDNLVKNGNWGFGFDSWLYASASLQDACVYVNNGYIMQQSIRVDSGITYTLGFEGYGNVYVNADIYGQYAGQTSSTNGILILHHSFEPSNLWTQHKVSFTVPSGVMSCYIKLQVNGAYRFRKIYLRQGDGVVGYTSNPNEIDGSGVSISEDAVNISTSFFNLDIRDSEGRVKSILSTDGNGFDNLICSNFTITDRKFYGDGTVHIYVNSNSGSDSNNGQSTYAPFKTIGRALKAVPLNIKGLYILHLSGGTYHENIYLSGGGSGRLNILGESAVLYGSISVGGSCYDLLIQSLNIYSTNTYCIYAMGNSGFLSMVSCLLDCNGVAASNGIYLYNGYRAYITGCEINNCGNGIYCGRGSMLDLVNCKGKGNTTAVLVNDMAIINAEGTVPVGDTISQEVEGGRIDGYIVGGIVGTNYQLPRDAIKTAVFNAIGKFSYIKGSMKNGVLIQGGNSGGFLVFDAGAVSSTLRGKTIKSVKVVVKRRGDDNLAHDGVLRAFTHNVASSSSGFSYVEEYGDICSIKRGEEVSIEIPLSMVAGMISGTVKGLLFYDNTNRKEHCVELDGSFVSRLEVLYV